MDTFKRVMLFVLGGGLIGQVIGTLMASPAVKFWAVPGYGPDTCGYEKVVTDVTADVQKWQFIGGLVTMVVGLVVGILLVRRANKAPKGPATPAPAAPPAAPPATP